MFALFVKMIIIDFEKFKLIEYNYLGKKKVSKQIKKIINNINRKINENKIIVNNKEKIETGKYEYYIKFSGIQLNKKNKWIEWYCIIYNGQFVRMKL